jgi:hypothetical protein
VKSVFEILEQNNARMIAVMLLWACGEFQIFEIASGCLALWFWQADHLNKANKFLANKCQS